MNTLLRKTLFAALFLLAAIGASAYDFEYEGGYYNVISSTRLTCEITYKEYQKETETYTGEFIIPETVKYGNDIYKVVRIGYHAFDDCTSLTSITIPEGVTSIGYYAFSACRSLTSVTIPEGVTSIERGAFQYCTSLTSVTIPEGVTSIGERTFYGCSSLTSITIPEGVIGNYAFSGCSGLASVTILEGVTSIGGSAFKGCSSLTSITIPEGVTSIGDDAFRICHLQLFEIADGTNPLVLSDDDFSSKELYIGRSIVAESTTASSECQFIPSDMEKVTFSRYVESLDYIGMDNATRLETVVALGKIPPTIADDFFSVDQYDNATLYVPEGAMQAYMEAPGWRFFYNIVEGVPTGISQVKSATDRMTVTADNGYIAISNAHGKVNVYDASGTMIGTAAADGGDVRMPVPGKGLYIVKAGGTAVKIAM